MSNSKRKISDVEQFSKTCDIYCYKRYWCINYAALNKGLQ